MSLSSKGKKSSKKKQNEDISWVIEGIVDFLRSPTWTVPVMNFIEEHCACFENREENRLEHTDIHNKYKSLVEKLLATYLKELQVSVDDFSSACNKRRSGFNKLEGLFEYIWAADDFLLFKRIMVNHNLELEMQAINFMQEKGEDGYGSEHPPYNPAFVPTEKADFYSSSDSSKTSSKENFQNILSQSEAEYMSVLQHLTDLQQKEEHDIQLAIKFSKEEMDRLNAQAEEERRMLEEAIRLSLQGNQQSSEKHNSILTEAPQTNSSTVKKVPDKPDVTIPPSQSASKPERTKSKSKAKEAATNLNLPPLQKEKSSAEAALDWLSSAQQQSSSTEPGPSHGTAKQELGSQQSKSPGIDPRDLAERKAYLQSQRQKLLEMKRKKRDAQLEEYNSQQTIKDEQSPDNTDNDIEQEKLLQARKALADRLKREVIKKDS